MNNENLNKLLVQRAYDALEDVNGGSSKDCEQIMKTRLLLEEVLHYHTFDWYFSQLPGLYIDDNDKITIADNDNLDCYLPNLSFQSNKWLITYSYDFDSSIYKVFMDKSPLNAVIKAYNWCKEQGFIRNNENEFLK